MTDEERQLLVAVARALAKLIEDASPDWAMPTREYDALIRATQDLTHEP